MPAAPPATTTPFPLEDVRPGMQAVAYTVFQGVAPEPMAVEILGRLHNALGPGRDMVLALLHGPHPEFTGVVAGMSGSPVYIGGKLLGALSFRIGQFSKEPIAGITPIGQMLEVERGGGPGATGSGPRATAADPAGGAAVGMQPIEESLVFSGFTPETLTRFGDAFRRVGLEPVAGLGSANPDQHQAAPLVPGSAVSLVLVDGDLSITGTCTVSYLERDQLMACGHPITQSGTISLPMAKAEVLATLASPLNSFKIVNATELVGAFTEDRASAIYGRVGATARMIPVQIHLTSAAPAYSKEIHLNVANHRELTPQLMLVSVFQSLQEGETAAAEASYHITGEIRLARHAADGASSEPLPPVRVDQWVAPSEFGPAAVTAALGVGSDFTQLFSNAQEQPVMTGVDLAVVVSPHRESAEIESARLLTPEVSAGGLVEVEAIVRPYRRPIEVVHLTGRLPASVGNGPVRLLVSDGATLDRLTASPSTHPIGLADSVARLNAEHRNNRVYLTVLDRNAQAVLDSAALTELPLSLANVLDPLKTQQQLRLNGESVVELGSQQLSAAVSGSQVLQVLVH